MTIGERIKIKRNELHLTQLKIKELTGISSGNMSDIENGKSLPSATALLQLSEIFECTTDWILKGDSLSSDNLQHLNSRESELINNFRSLSPSEQKEIMDFIDFKVSRVKGDAEEVEKLSDSQVDIA